MCKLKLLLPVCVILCIAGFAARLLHLKRRGKLISLNNRKVVTRYE